MPTKPLTHATLLRGVNALTARDTDLHAIVARYGPPPLWSRRPGFASLVHIILGQQVSLASADAAYARLRRIAGRVSATRVASLTHEQLTAAGLTRQKARYCRTLAAAIVEGDLNLRSLRDAEPDVVRTELTRLPGIGRWTADIYLLMALGRPDVWPRGDLALYNAMREIKRLDDDADSLDRLAESWRPWRAVAARILWHHYLMTRRARRR